MAKDNFSFDIVSEVDMQEVDNAVNQAKKELAQRYDFKGSKSSIDLKRDEKKIILFADEAYRLNALTDMLAGKLIKRGISTKSLTFKDPQHTTSNSITQEVEITMGIVKEKAKDLVAIIKGLGLKVQPQIEGEKVRVFSPKKDDLQAVMGHLRKIDFPLALSFNNYR
jgi:uncharacterized protein YajQ (UPF0234 family)